MRSSYRTIGSCIHLVDERNIGLNVSTLLGVSISKELMPSVANIVGADMENYKIIRKNQFTCSLMQVRRDGRIPIAILKDFDEAIVSQAYPVFEVINTEEVLPDYLMMWFSRSEFDRESCFYAIGGVRGSLEWDDFCNMQLPVPHPDKQKEIVREYNVLKDRMALNNMLIHKLEETAQAIYKQWFVDFEFPDENGKPYKSSGGEIIWCEKLEKEIPKWWELAPISNLITVKDGTHDTPEPTDSGYPLVTSAHLNLYNIQLNKSYNISEVDFLQINRRSKVEKFDILFSMIGTVGLISYVLSDDIQFAIKNIGLFKSSERKEFANYILFYLKSDYVKQYLKTNLNAGVQSYATLGLLRNMPILIPSEEIIVNFNSCAQKFINNIQSIVKELELLESMSSILFSKLSTIKS